MYGVYTYYKAGGRPFNTAENVIYGTFSRFVWGLALAWVIYACNKGYGSKSVLCVLRLLKTVHSTFRDVDFDESL